MIKKKESEKKLHCITEQSFEPEKAREPSSVTATQVGGNLWPLSTRVIFGTFSPSKFIFFKNSDQIFLFPIFYN